MRSALPALRLVAAVAAVAAVGVLVAGCGSRDSAVTAGSCGDAELIVAASDYSSSRICAAPGDCAKGSDLGDDPMLAATNGRAFFLARDMDLLFELDPSCGTPISRLSVSSFSPTDPMTGEKRPANPHDVAAAPDGTVVVPLYTAGRVVFFKDGQIEPASIDLAEFDPDGNPQADAVRIVSVDGAAKAFITLERLDDADLLRSKQTSQMLRIDIATRSVDGVFDLEGRNPFNPMSELAGALFMAEPGNFDDDGEELAGIERFDTATSTSRLVVRERDLGGSVSEIAVTDGCGAAIIAGPQKDVNPTWVVTFDPETGRVLTTKESPILGPTPGYDLQGLAWRGNSLYVGDRRPSETGYAVHVFDRQDGCTLVATGRRLDLPQRPVALRPAQQLQSR